MRRKVLSGLATLLLVTGGCGEEPVLIPPREEQTTQSQKEEKPKPDMTINLEILRGWRDPTLIVNKKRHYLFVKKDDTYHLLRIDPNQITELVMRLDNPNHESRTMNLGDRREYTLVYNSKTEDYELSVKEEN